MFKSKKLKLFYQIKKMLYIKKYIIIKKNYKNYKLLKKKNSLRL